MRRYTNKKPNFTNLSMVNEYFDLVCSTLEVSRQELISNSRKTKYAYPRFCLIYLLYYRAQLSSPTLCRIFNRDHKTIFHAIKQYELMLKDKKKYARIYRNKRNLKKINLIVNE